MRETLEGYRNFVVRYKYVLALGALVAGPSFVTLGTVSWYFDGVIGELKAAHAVEVARYQAEVDYERVINRGVLEQMRDNMAAIAERMGIAAEKVQDAAIKAESAAQDAAKAASTLPEVTPTPEDQP